ncbi:hypothetical protein [Allorhizobium taibaishanense]|uniref:Uncharacterized protein n=1 Tax=Allorhizobium taibaishanense TaxID=887144 RepID=A0A1Q9A6J8_9HYPH|nr:hypothetical protein [Allorhizobium taibaishanense]MBB4008647.1 hypothetical protein [Allorhizobium taibaishanense]OLP50218.1 hypothetical protein BJF91_12890 [Allorhizobium taibaishanense]
MQPKTGSSSKTNGHEGREVEKDAKGQFAKTQSGGDNDGVVSAKPQVITGSQDATIHNIPPQHKPTKP